MTTTRMTTVWVRRSKLLPSSSTANTTPAIGVLKAAETPAAPPAMMIARRPGPPLRPRVRVRRTPATTCTVGPSRPTEPPHSSIRAVNTIFQAAVARVTRWPSQRPVHRCSAAAITCGMPLPAVVGAKRLVIQAIRAKPTGSSARVGQRAAAKSWA